MAPSSWAAFDFLPHFLFETVGGVLHTITSSRSLLSDEEVPSLLSPPSKLPHGCLLSRSDSLGDSQSIIEPRTGSVVSAEAALTFLAGGGGMGHPEQCGRRRSSGITHAQHQNLAKLFILNTIENNQRVPSLLQTAVIAPACSTRSQLNHRHRVLLPLQVAQFSPSPLSSLHHTSMLTISTQSLHARRAHVR